MSPRAHVMIFLLLAEEAVSLTHDTAHRCRPVSRHFRRDISVRTSFPGVAGVDGPIIEGGSNIGEDLVGFIRAFPSHHIYSFEPVPPLVAALRAKPDVVNASNRVHIIQASLGGAPGTLTLMTCGTSALEATMATEFASGLSCKNSTNITGCCTRHQHGSANCFSGDGQDAFRTEHQLRGLRVCHHGAVCQLNVAWPGACAKRASLSPLTFLRMCPHLRPAATHMHR